MNIQKWINCILQFFHCFFCKFCQGTPPSGALQLAVPAHVFFAAPVASGEVLTHPPAPIDVRKKSSPTERDAGKTWGSTGIAHFNQFQWRFSLIWHLNLTHRLRWLKLSLLLDYSFKPLKQKQLRPACHSWHQKYEHLGKIQILAVVVLVPWCPFVCPMFYHTWVNDFFAVKELSAVPWWWCDLF